MLTSTIDVSPYMISSTRRYSSSACFPRSRNGMFSLHIGHDRVSARFAIKKFNQMYSYLLNNIHFLTIRDLVDESDNSDSLSYALFFPL